MEKAVLVVEFSLHQIGKITLYWNKKGWFLIFLSIVDKNINLTTICFWSKNQLVLIKISNLRKMSILTKNQIWQNSQIWRTSQILQKMSKFPPAPPPPPILWMCYLIFSGPKWNLSKPKGNRLYNEIVTVVIWMLS